MINVKDYGALGDNMGTVVAEWLTGGTYDRGYENLAAIQADYPWVETLFDTIDFAACQKALDVAWKNVQATYGKDENETAGGLNDGNSSRPELTKSGSARSEPVSFPDGFYKINKTLIKPPRVNVVGVGGKNTTLRYTGDTYTSTGVTNLVFPEAVIRILSPLLEPLIPWNANWMPRSGNTTLTACFTRLPRATKACIAS